MMSDSKWVDQTVRGMLNDIDRTLSSKIKITEQEDRQTSQITFPDGEKWEVPHARFRSAEDNRALFVRLKLRLTS